MAIHCLPAGGAEKFFTTLACALAPRHELHCYIPCRQGMDAGMMKRLAGIPVKSIPLFNDFGYKVFFKLRQMIMARFPSIDIEARVHAFVLRRLRRRWPFDVVNTHLFYATRFCCETFAEDSVPIIESDHGHYAFLEAKDMPQARSIFGRLNTLVCPSSANLEFSRRFPWNDKLKRSVIPYGHERQVPARERSAQPAVITLGMVARGVVWKGWKEALAAARVVRERVKAPFRLVFVGAGPCVDEIAMSLSEEDRRWIEITGHQDEPEKWIADFDIGLLPTYLPGESLPNSIIEYLSHGVPVIATPVGGIPEMLSTPQGPAGILVEQEPDGRAGVSSLAEAMTALITQHDLRAQLSARAKMAARRYDLGSCVEAYERVMAEAVRSN
ncbi:glycosyltransferase family 4 protein [Prosthecobacter vanneervenii]|nr:glycosyltransferase family 4 protein [Prosthecobacter vanneervenii]